MTSDSPVPAADQDRPPDSKPAAPGSAIEKEQLRLVRAAADLLAKQAESQPTHQLGLLGQNSITDAPAAPFEIKPGHVSSYTALPVKLRNLPAHSGYPWRVELHGLPRTAEPIGLDILGDVVIGRGSLGVESADIDLDPYGAFELGVSRRHAMLRPSTNALYIIDLDSTNGTLHNALRLGSGITRALSNNDTVTLGRLSFMIRIIDGPGLKKQEEASRGETAEPPASAAGGGGSPQVQAPPPPQPGSVNSAPPEAGSASPPVPPADPRSQG